MRSTGIRGISLRMRSTGLPSQSIPPPPAWLSPPTAGSGRTYIPVCRHSQSHAMRWPFSTAEAVVDDGGPTLTMAQRSGSSGWHPPPQSPLPQEGAGPRAVGMVEHRPGETISRVALKNLRVHNMRPAFPGVRPANSRALSGPCLRNQTYTRLHYHHLRAVQRCKDSGAYDIITGRAVLYRHHFPVPQSPSQHLGTRRQCTPATNNSRSCCNKTKHYTVSLLNLLPLGPPSM